MNRWAGWAFKIMIAGLLTGIILGFVTPRALGFSSPAQLWRTTRLNTTIVVENLSPGDVVKQNVEIGNDGSKPIYYRIVFIKQGKIWSCDAGGHSLEYQLAWSQGADRHLQPGEVEMVDIEVALPLSAQNGCMGQSGSLFIRHGAVEEQQDAGVYECFLLSVFDRNMAGTADPSNTRGMICYRSGGPLDRMFNLNQ